MDQSSPAGRLLHIASSPRGEASESRALAEAFLESFADVHPEVEIETFDLWDGSLPAFGPAAASAKMAVFAGRDPEGGSAEAWKAAREVFRRFDSADRYLFSVPMWNHGVPYILKQFIDVISQPGLVFSFDPTAGYTGLLQNKKAAAIYTSAVYGVGRPASFGSDFQQPYLRDWLQWAGISELTEVTFRPNLATAHAESGRQVAHAEARDAGKTF